MNKSELPDKEPLKWKIAFTLIISAIFLVFYYFTIAMSGPDSLVAQKIKLELVPTVLIVLGSIFLFLSLSSGLVRQLNTLGLTRNDWRHWLIVLGAIVAIGVLFTLSTYTNYLQPSPALDPSSPKKAFALMLLPNFLFVTLTFAVAEAWSALRENQALQLRLVAIEKEKVASQLAALQQKINPHFLFNSLSVLSELIHKDVDKADEFIHEFSQIYRYVLEFQEEVAVPLEKELEFLKAYAFLEKIRFGDNLIVNISIDQHSLSKCLPSLSLQLLFENAVKHNRASKEEPLTIVIENTQDTLLVKNNRQPRMDVPVSNGVGLSNLSKTYELISESDFRYYEKEAQFIVELPLINCTQP